MKARVNISVMLILLILLAFPLGTIVPAAADSQRCELILKFKPGVNERLKSFLIFKLGLEVTDEISQLNMLVISVPQRVSNRVKYILNRNPYVDFVEENVKLSTQAVPNDYYYPLQWHLTKIGAPSAWDFSTGNRDIIIAVLDSGVDPSHPDLTNKLLAGWNFYDNNGNTTDVTGHGTAVAGVAAASTNNSIGVAGVAWQCNILPIRVTNTNGYTSYSLLSKGLVYAADRGAKVAVISFLIFNGSASLTSAAKYFVEKGGIVVASGGNTGKFENYADNPYIISVSGTTDSDKNWGSFGPYIDLSAPCSAIFTTINGGGYSNVGGTSFSAPIVAGVAALIFSVNPSLSPNQVEQILEASAVDLGEPGYDFYYGWGRVDAYSSLRLATGVSPPPIDTTPPSVTITYPKSGNVISGSVTISVEASDNGGVSKVELYKNGTLFAVDNVAPYEFYWDTVNDEDGVYELKAKAYDVANNMAESSPIYVKVENAKAKNIDLTPPVLKIIQPLNGSQVSRRVDIIVSVSDESGINKVEFYIDDRLIYSLSVEPYVYRWNSRSVKNGWHKITVKAYDNYGNCAEANIVVYVSNRK